MAAHIVNNIKEFEGYVNEQKEKDNYLIVVNFTASWSDSALHMNSVFHQLAKNYPSHNFYQVDAEEVEDIADRYEVTRVPTFIFLKGGVEIAEARLTGASAPALAKKVEELTAQFSTTPKKTIDPVEALNERLKKLVNYAPIMLFMKGTPDVPQCGFSRKIVDILKKNKVKFCSFNILSDEDVRNGLKNFSNWQTYPQLYVKGQLVGGLDIVSELDEEGELMMTLAPGLQTEEDAKKKLNERISKLIASDAVMLFIKGTPDRPQCGFSSKIISLLNNQGVRFSSFNILNDEEIRQGLKEFSNWPTYPQLYINSELVGGLDIVTELAESGELKDMIPNSHVIA